MHDAITTSYTLGRLTAHDSRCVGSLNRLRTNERIVDQLTKSERKSVFGLATDSSIR